DRMPAIQTSPGRFSRLYMALTCGTGVSLRVTAPFCPELICGKTSLRASAAAQHSGALILARPAGLEPATPSLEGSCSIQLSYGRVGCADSVLSPRRKSG